MAYPYTESGFNMFDMLSMIQKAIRRGLYDKAGFAAKQLTGMYRSTMWNRLLVISSEDCYGVLTKELIHLREQDGKKPDDSNISNAVALLCRALKSRDACYFSCNFILDPRRPRVINTTDEEINEFHRWINRKRNAALNRYDTFGFEQASIFDNFNADVEDPKTVIERDLARDGVKLQKAIEHLDMDMIGSEMDGFRRGYRDYLWDVFHNFAEKKAPELIDEIKALEKADCIVNKNKADLKKDEIFISKAAMLFCYYVDEKIDNVLGCDIMHFDSNVDWEKNRVKSILDCFSNTIPEWVYDCHTLKGKKEGKTDWDMTTTEQAALYPLCRAYFDDASWIYTYEQDFTNGVLDDKGMKPIREYAKTHVANPVAFIPYE